jgi:hypothetical protein
VSKRLSWWLTFAATLGALVFPTTGTAAGRGNGGSARGLSDPPITVGAGWFATTKSPPAFFWDESGFNIEGPFTFSSTTTVLLRVTDDFCKGDVFRVYDFGAPIGQTSRVPVGPCREVGPAAAFADPIYSSGSFPLAAGSHSIRIRAIVNPFGSGRGYLRVDVLSKKMCKRGGWRTLATSPRFRNQGDCVSFVATGGRNRPAGG